MQIYSEMTFENPKKIITAFDERGLKNAFEEIEALTQNAFALGYVRYEAKEAFCPKGSRPKPQKLPLLYFEVYENSKPYMPAPPNDFNLNPVPSIDFPTYESAIKTIKNEISNGNTYEVNYTYDWILPYDGCPKKLYENLLAKQKTPYNTFIRNEYETLLSFSPELFFELERTSLKIKTKPMKGTVKRGQTHEQDEENINFLQNDIKNRAENVMIVDLLRNDLGKIAKTGSVKTQKLFEIETHKTLHQMTSEVCAELKEDTSFYDIFEAIFPCGSITGAPKISTMEIIDKVETGKRDIYCGAIGFITPKKAVFSVPIRVLQKTHEEKAYRYRVGGAIVWDSDTKDEWEETFTKTSFLRGNPSNVNEIQPSDFKLLETMKVEHGQILYKTEHLQRLENSADFFGFKFNEDLKNIRSESDGMLRLLLSKDGSFETQTLPLIPPKTNAVKISQEKTNSVNPFLSHKTTHRPHYEQSLLKIKSGEVFDEIFFNEKDELTEGARSNIIVQIDGRQFTPPLTCGLLNGILRQKLLDEGHCTEKNLTRKDLENAEKIFCVNSVRGVTEVVLR